MIVPQTLPLLTPDIPGIGGEIKQHPEDFVVEELPAYQPIGSGEHLFLWIEKRDTSAEQLQQHLSRTLKINSRDIGTAGLKDRRAVTRQFVSVPVACEANVVKLETEQIAVLRQARHGNKLRTGHSRGNRFSILVRNVSENAIDQAEAVCRHIQQHGFPNYFGVQRFGNENETLALGLELIAGKKQPRDLPASRRRFLLRLALSAAQSYLFNCALSQRLADNLFSRVLAGDVMQVVASGGPFVAEDVEREQARFDNGETAITGPMFGPKMREPMGETAERERMLLSQCGLSDGDFLRHRKLTSGTRRPFQIRPEQLVLLSEESGLRIQFALPKGAYATSLLREFQEGNDSEPPRNC